MKSLNKNKGVSLIAAVAIIVIMAIVAVVLASNLGTTSRRSVDYSLLAKAFALAQGGLNYYMTQLESTPVWATATTRTNVPLGDGTFDITFGSSTQATWTATTWIDITSAGKVAGPEGATIKRTMSQRAWKLPSASKFALFWGRFTGTNLTLSSTTIDGDYWSRGSSIINSPSTVINGIAYCPDTQSVTGTGAFTTQTIAAPYPNMPAINAGFYTNLISTYNGIIAANGSAATINQNTNLVLTGNTINCRTFNTNTTAGSSVTISGNGIIVANRDIFLNTAGGNGRTLTISPSGGSIVFLAGRSLTVNAAGGTNVVSSSNGVTMYSQSVSANTQLLTVNNANTTINGATLLANRRIIVQAGADVINSTLFVNYPGTTANNYLRVTGSGTRVGTLAGSTYSPCNLISIARLTGTPSALTVDTNASIVGFLYQYDTANSGSTRLNSATIRGSVIANQFQGNVITSSTVTYDPLAIPDPPAEGFDGFVTKKPDSWSGN